MAAAGSLTSGADAFLRSGIGVNAGAGGAGAGALASGGGSAGTAVNRVSGGGTAAPSRGAPIVGDSSANAAKFRELLASAGGLDEFSALCGTVDETEQKKLPFPIDELKLLDRVRLPPDQMSHGTVAHTSQVIVASDIADNIAPWLRAGKRNKVRTPGAKPRVRMVR